jgi:eukaryotic-like serine/threonine-protein kinase
VSQAVDAPDLRTLAEASMDPNLVHVLRRYARFAEAVAEDPARALPVYEELGRDLALDASNRSEALRTVIVRLAGALNAVASAPSLQALAPAGGADPEVIATLETALGSLGQLAVGARRRLDPEASAAAPPAVPHPLSIAMARVLSGADPKLGENVVASSLDHLLANVPRAISKLVAAVVWRIVELPKQGPHPSNAVPSVRTATETLPAWLPARRTIGGFFVVRALSAGAVGSVFVVTRVEDKADANAEKFALKVPEYSAGAARSLSEAEFMKMFREEAGALIALPHHKNLAHFVTFDAGSKPKPILVMELVEGTTLERMIEARGLDARRALRILADVISGLCVMHAVGIGHLDLKPSNVVLRRGEEAVLVDFGLAGRHIRPGCATGPYGAPEVWGAVEGKAEGSPAKADVYAFGCLAYEALTGRVLFEGNSELAQVAMHVAHDGSPEPIRALAKRADLAPLAELLFSTLRRDPRDRPSAEVVRKDLERITPSLGRTRWPIV